MIDFNTEPYFDDYSELKDFYRILFRPSYAVQARELTQVQTILQNQVTRFGDHMFKNGSQVIPGSVNVDNRVHFIKLEQFSGTLDVTTFLHTMKDMIITGSTSGVKMRVVDTSNSSYIDKTGINITPTLYCKIEGTASDNETHRFAFGEKLVATTADNSIATNFRLKEDLLELKEVVVKLTGSNGEPATAYTNNSSSDVFGYAMSVDVQPGIYYIDGIFVRNSELKLFPGRFSNNPSARIGFKIIEETITPEDDSSILDNATGSYNFAAPGAHRYKISLSLVSLPLTTEGKTGTDNIRFVELVRVVDGRIQFKKDRATYAELEKTLARRTFDESGNYEVNKFKLSAREHKDNGTNYGVYADGRDDKFVMVVDPGKAYIQGYEVESTASQFLEFQKAREDQVTLEENNHVQRVSEQTVGINIGNYAIVKNVYKTPDLATFQKVYLVNYLQPRPASLRAVITGGVVTSIIIDDGGIGYTSAPTITFANTSAGGSGASVTAVITGGRVTGFTSLVGGSAYTTAPEVRCISNITLGAAPVSSTIVGTARVKTLQLYSSTYTYGQTTEFKLGLFDIQMFNGNSFERDVKSVIGTNANNNFCCDISPNLVSLIGTATSVVGNTTVNGVGTNFGEVLKAGDVLFLNDTYVGVVSTANNLAVTLAAPGAAVAISGGRISVFSSVLNEPNFGTLLFPVGPNVIKTLRGVANGNDTVKSTTITIRRKLTTPTVSTNSVSFELSDGYETFLSDDLQNHTLFCSDTNLPVNTSTANIDFDSDTTRKKITFKQVPAGTYYCIASIQQTSNTAAERRKYVVRSQEQQIVGKKYISAPTIDLPHADILKLVAVYMTPGAPDAYNDSIKVNITDHFTLDNGQRDTFYTNGKLLLKPGYPVPSGALKVVYDYFNIVSTDTGNYFSVDSYRHLIAGVDYDEIPSYSVTDPSTGKKIEVSLADVVDFRPVLVSQSYNYFYPELPKMGSDLISPVANYLGRVDKVVLDSVGKLNVISGVPSADPKEPEDPKDGLVLATVNVPPYTKKVGDVVIKQRDNRRYTMKDIGKLERRISNLEYYVSLNLLEKDTATMQIKDDTTGLDRFKNGFIVDQFTGHNIGDVKNEDYKIAVDSEARVLRPMHNTVAVEVVENLVAGADRAYKDYRKTGDLITLPYTEDTYIFNNNATRAMDIQAMSSGAFKGQVVLVPEGDSWKSITRRPDLVAVDDNNYDAIKYLGEELGVTGTKWNEWQTNWTSITTRVPVRYETSVYTGYASQYIHTGYEATFTDYSGYNWRDGINTSLTSSVNAQDYGDRVVDMSYIPFMRSRPVTFIAQNLKPSTKFFPFFDNTDVSEYVKPADKMTVQRVGTTSLAFDQQSLDNNILNDVPARASDGKVEAAFSVGDVLMTAAEHTPTQITAITRLTIASPSFNITVNKQDNILPGHHVVLYNLDFHIAYDEKNYDELHENQIIPASSGIVANTSTSKQLNLRKFKVLATSGKVITLGNIDGTDVEAFDAYSTDSYDVGSFGMVYRLKASAVVAHGGQVTSTDTYGNLVQEIFLVNVKNGFAINETLQGTVTIGTSSAYNGVTVKYINGANSATSASPLLAKGDAVITDSEGTAVGVFYLPETAALSFRTGERTFKLTDNQSNSSSAFDSVGTSVYYAQGISLSKERTIVSTRTAEFVQTPAYEDTQNLPPVRRTTTSIKQIYQWVQDPLAQTFDVSADGGVFVTSVDLYFATLGKRPVSIELRNTDNGVPSTKVVPFSKVTKSIGELTASTKGETATRFTFKSPVYLQDAETYALVVMTDEPGTQIFVSEMGQKDLITKNDIVGQPLTGSLYASQNSKEWEIHSLLDMKFTLNKAKFDIATTSEVILKATTPELYKLPDNPFEITPGTNKIRVWAPDHGLLANDIVVISNVARDSYGTSKTDPLKLGISSKLLNAAHTVLSTGLEKDSFIIDLVTVDGSGNSLLSGANTDFVKGYYGGSGVMCSRGINMDVMYLKTSDLNFQETTLSYSVMAHKASDPTSAGFTSYLPVVANSNFNFPTRMHIASYENQIVENSTKQPDLLIKASLYSSNANISPAIDMQQFSVFAISNLVNKSSAATINVAAIDTRKVLAGNDISLSNTELSGTGTITSSTSSTTVTGTSTVFTTQVVGGNKLYTTESTPRLIGTVASTPSSNTSLTLTGNAAIAYTGGFYVSSTPSLIFENVNGVGIIRTNIDSADNQLSSAGIGKTLTISGVDPTNVDGTYVVTNIIVEDDSSTYAGNSELDKIKVYLDRAFGASSTTIDMTTDTDFNISVLDRYVEDFAPVGAYNFANYITRTLSLTESADTIKIMFDANIVNKTDIKVYYRTWSGNVDLRKIPYVDSGFSATSYDTEGKFMERNIDISGIASFNNLSVKIVFKSTDPVSVPKIKNLRILALS